MSKLLSRKDLFYVEFTKKLIPSEIEDFYRPYVKDMPTQINSPRLLVSTSVQGITVPSYQFDSATQYHVDTLNNNQIGTEWRSVTNPQENTEKTFTLTFKLLNGYINYWIMLDTFFYHYDMKNPEPFVGDISLRILDSNGLVMFTRKYRNCIMKGISDFELSYSDNIQTFETFTVTMGYSSAETEFGNPGNPSSFTKNPSKYSGKAN